MKLLETMRAMVLERPGRPLQMRDLPVPQPGPGQVLLKVLYCGVCRTDLHIFDGELTEPKLPLIMGHEIVGQCVSQGPGVSGVPQNELIGVPWLGYSCGACRFCRAGQENLCEKARYTGYHLDGGYAEYCLADHRYCFELPPRYMGLQAAPLMCAGLIGLRCYRLLPRPVKRLGLYGFGAAAHILAQIARAEGIEVYAFVRPSDEPAKAFARKLGAVWAGDSDQPPPEPLDSAIIFAPVGALVPKALEDTGRGGNIVCGGIYMSDIPSFPYSLLWQERSLRSVANLTREDGLALMEKLRSIDVQLEVTAYPLEEANQALEDLRQGRFTGAAVLKVGGL